MSVPFDLTCWYLNARRIAEITGVTPVAPPGTTDPQSARTAQLIQLKNTVVAWMKANSATPLEGKRHLATAYSKLEKGKLEFEFHDEHLTSDSSWHELAGQQRKFVLGVVTNIQGGTIKCAPYVIANIVNPHSALQGDGSPWYNHLEVHVNEIDSFDKAQAVQVRLTKASLNSLKDVPEMDIKTAFGEIINEPVIPKDWGGEASDLFSSRVVLDGKRISTAFLFKGQRSFIR